VEIGSREGPVAGPLISYLASAVPRCPHGFASNHISLAPIQDRLAFDLGGWWKKSQVSLVRKRRCTFGVMKRRAAERDGKEMVQEKSLATTTKNK
jgi:hypothetical protein